MSVPNKAGSGGGGIQVRGFGWCKAFWGRTREGSDTTLSRMLPFLPVRISPPPASIIPPPATPPLPAPEHMAVLLTSPFCQLALTHPPACPHPLALLLQEAVVRLK